MKIIGLIVMLAIVATNGLEDTTMKELANRNNKFSSKLYQVRNLSQFLIMKLCVN